MNAAHADFQAAMLAAGIESRDPIIADGRLHRVKINGDAGPNGWYVLHGDGLPAGIFGCWKRGIRETWCSKPDTELTEAERAERDRRWRQQQEIRDAERRRQHDAASIEAQKVLDAAHPATDDHPYLQRKRVHAHPGVRVGSWPQRKADNCLLIPLRTAAGKLASVQAIFSEKRGDRDKDFLKSGAKTGAYFVIGDLDASETILIAEGYATAATLHETSGHAAVMACDAGNLKPVAQAIRALYPNKTIIVCADNDRHTAGNPGLTKATAAAKTIKAALAVPQFEDSEDGSDFNDLARTDIERFRRTIGAAGKPATAKAETAKSWEQQLKRDLYGDVMRIHHNAVLIAEHTYPGLIGYNEFTQRIEARTASPWREEPGPWTDYDTQELAFHIVTEPHSLPPFRLEMLETGIQTAARRHAFDPAKERLQAFAGQWDGVSRLVSWLADYLGAEITEANSAYLAELGPAFLKGVVARVLYPGCKRDDVLTIVGPQGYGKSRAAQAIADAICPDTFTDSLGNLGSDEAAIGIRGVIIAEFSELAAVGRSELEQVKAFISRKSDRYREKYARNTSDHPRTCSFIATTNEDSGFLRDPSGNRRWWPITITRPIDISALEQAAPQLLGEAAARVLAGEPWHVSNAVAIQQAESIREDCADSDVWEPAILHAAARLHDRDRTIGTILSDIGMATERQDRRAQTRVSNILRANGYQRKRGRGMDGQRGYLWAKGDSISREEGQAEIRDPGEKRHEEAILSPISIDEGQKGDSVLASQKAACPYVPICPPSKQKDIEIGEKQGENSGKAKKKFIGKNGGQGGQGGQRGGQPAAPDLRTLLATEAGIEPAKWRSSDEPPKVWDSDAGRWVPGGARL